MREKYYIARTTCTESKLGWHAGIYHQPLVKRRPYEQEGFRRDQREAACVCVSGAHLFVAAQPTLSAAAWDRGGAKFSGTLIDEEICAESHICCRDYALGAPAKRKCRTGAVAIRKTNFSGAQSRLCGWWKLIFLYMRARKNQCDRRGCSGLDEVVCFVRLF